MTGGLSMYTEIGGEDFTISCYDPTPTLSFGELIILFGFLGLFSVAAGVFKYAARNKDVFSTLFQRDRQPVLLSRVKIAAPCKTEWKWMCGDGRVRFCGQCKLNVYNLSVMTREEAERLIRQTEGQLGARFYRRKDGTVLTKNCPVALRAIKDRLTSTRAHVLAASLGFLAYLGILLTWL